MFNSVSGIGRVTNNLKSHCLSRFYALIIVTPQGKKISLITPTEFGFIHDGIINPPLRNILDKKDIHLDHYHTSHEYLNMNNNERAKAIALDTFHNRNQFNQYCMHHHIEIIDTYIVEN